MITRRSFVGGTAALAGLFTIPKIGRAEEIGSPKAENTDASLAPPLDPK